jgi:hypothetical protein
MQFNTQLDDEPIIDGSVPIAGVDNAQPPSAIGPTLAADAENRLASLDGLNRPRPGIIRLQQPSASFDSIHHLGAGLFLYNDAGKWFQYDSRSKVNITLTGGPSFAHGDNVYSALSDDKLYFSAGGGQPTGGPLWKFVPGTDAGSGFTAVTLPDPYTSALYPIWALYRLIYAYENTLIISDILDPEIFNLTTQLLTLDPIKSDYITGQCLWQNQQLAVFRNGSTWMVQTGPNLPVLDWELDRASATVGCCCHGTIVQCGVDVYFLSETGRGVYALSQMPTSNQMGVWQPISQPIKRYIDRINWSAIQCARATYWNDTYQLAVPLDGATYNTHTLIFSVTLNSWQGLWCHEDANGNDISLRDFARDRTNPDGTVLLLGTLDGCISQVTYPTDRRYWDQNIDGTKVPFTSSLMSRAFTFGGDMQQQYQFGGKINQIQPHSAQIQFIESDDPVDVTIWGDRTVRLLDTSSPTTNYLLTLTIPGFPFDLDKTGYYNLPMSLMNVGICNELQVELSGIGNWTVYQMKLAAFEAMPLVKI